MPGTLSFKNINDFRQYKGLGFSPKHLSKWWCCDKAEFYAFISPSDESCKSSLIHVSNNHPTNKPKAPRQKAPKRKKQKRKKISSKLPYLFFLSSLVDFDIDSLNDKVIIF